MVERDLDTLAFHAARRIPPKLTVPFYRWLQRLTRDQEIIVRSDGSFWVVTNETQGESYYFPEYPHLFQIKKMAKGYGTCLREKYTLTNFIEVEPDDTVVDVGAFIGAFSLAVSDDASEVVAIEPTPETATCLRRNTGNKDNIKVYETVIGPSTDTVEYHIAADPTDNSLFEADSSTKNTITLRQAPLHRVIGTETIDMLKIDAEGAEPEVLNGCKELEFEKLAVDCSPERDGQSTIQSVTDILSSWAYEIKISENIVFARR